ncbi:MAG: 16S rRNA (cytosine(1402)-N(4))-methyltransferase RsmH [Patescibacteria group bacterium]
MHKQSLASSAGKYHESVMVKEVLESLHISNKLHFNKGSRIIDCTLGTGGHTEAIIKAGGTVLGIEADPKMLDIAKKRLKSSAKLVLGNFSDIEQITKDNNFTKIDGILFDLGVSNLHFKDDERGFSFSDGEQDLDMRLNPEIQGVKASDLLNVLDQTQLTQLFEKVISHNESKRIAGRIISVRPINKVSELIKLLQGLPHKTKLNPATLPMLALRIAVNSELDNLNEVIPVAFDLLKKGGKLLIITFHSAEEKILEKYINARTKIRIPSYEEINKNIRSRSAKLYVYTKN